MNKALVFGLFFILNSFHSFSQRPLNKPKDLGPKSKIEIINADSLVGDNQSRIFYGHVVFKHKGVILSCNRANSNETQNNIEAFGNVKINQGDTLTITGDTLFYFGDTRLAEIRGKNVVLIDKKNNSTLKSRQINYDLNTNLAYYKYPGVINQDSTVLKSNSGYYNTELKTFRYIGDVSITQPNFLLLTDTLEYDSKTRWAFFNTPTSISSKDGNLNTLKGKYNTQTKASEFLGQSKVINESYSLIGDTLNYNQITGDGEAKGNVEFISFKDSVTIYGDYALKEGPVTKVLNNAYLRQIDGGDTLRLKANEMYAIQIEDSAGKEKNLEQKMDKLIASGNVKMFRDDFQSVCDSLNYSIIDSTIFLVGKPIIWSQKSQLEGDSVQILLSNKKLKKINLIGNSFIISKDSIQNFNQVKGRKSEANFDSLGRINIVQVDGNGQSLYYALDDKNKMIGLNYVECSKMRILFIENKVKKIAFLGNPESKLIAPSEIKKEDMVLENFKWKEDLMPTKNIFR